MRFTFEKKKSIGKGKSSTEWNDSLIIMRLQNDLIDSEVQSLVVNDDWRRI